MSATATPRSGKNQSLEPELEFLVNFIPHSEKRPTKENYESTHR